MERYITNKILILLCLSGIIVFYFQCSAKGSQPFDFQKKREQMINTQIEARGIKNKHVLSAMRNVKRHLFVPEKYKHQAYDDNPLPIGEGQTISQPYIVALMTAVLNMDKKKNILEIGTGSGYQAAVLAEICNKVYTIEIIDILGMRAKKILDTIGYKNIQFRIGDGYKGWKEFSPFDAIIVTCSPTHVPQPLKDQLAEGGNMIIPVGKGYSQYLVLLTKKDGKIIKNKVIPVRFVPMVREDGKIY